MAVPSTIFRTAVLRNFNQATSACMRPIVITASDAFVSDRSSPTTA